MTKSLSKSIGIFIGSIVGGLLSMSILSQSWQLFGFAVIGLCIAAGGIFIIDKVWTNYQ